MCPSAHGPFQGGHAHMAPLMAHADKLGLKEQTYVKRHRIYQFKTKRFMHNQHDWQFSNKLRKKKPENSFSCR